MSRLMIMVDRESGSSTLTLVLCDTEDALRRVDAALNEHSPEGAARRTSISLYDVALDWSPAQ